MVSQNQLHLHQNQVKTKPSEKVFNSNIQLQKENEYTDGSIWTYFSNVPMRKDKTNEALIFGEKFRANT